MAIQIPNAGTGNGATGDNEFVLWTKVINNFSDQTNAASKLVGTATGQIPLAQDVAKLSGVFAADLTMYGTQKTGNANDFEVGSKYLVGSDNVLNCPTDAGSKSFLIETSSMFSLTNAQLQIATVYNDRVGRYIRIKSASTWLAWQPLSITPATYNTTTALGANVVVDAAGKLMRSTSIAYTNTNTTKDSNGFIKAASPIVKVFADKVELNGEAVDQDVTYKKNGVGDYAITTVSGLSTDGWYIELPKDMNGNPKVAVTLSEAEGVISLKTYKRIFSMETFTFEPDLDNPLDIPDTRWIDLRLNEIPVEIEDDIQTEV